MFSHSLEIFRGITISFILKALGAVCQFMMTVVISRQLGAAAAGVFFLGVTIINMLSVAARFGTDNYLVKKVSELNARGEFGICWMYIDTVLKGVMLVSGLAALGLWFLSPVLSVRLFGKPELQEVLQWMSVLVVLLSTGLVISFALQGYKKILESVSIQNVITPLLTTLGSLVLIQTYHVKGAIFAFGVGLLVTVLYAWSILSRQRAASFVEFRPKTISWKNVWSESKSFYLLSVMNQAIAWTPLLVLGVFSDSGQVGIFQATNRTAFLVAFVLVASNSIIAPKIAELDSLGQRKLLQETVQNYTFLLSMASLPVVLLFLFFSRQILALFGSDYVSGGNVLQILVAGQFVNVVAGPVLFLLAMTGYVSAAGRVVVLSAVASLALSLVLIPFWGILGAGLATTSTMVLQNVLAAVEVKRKLGFVNVPKPILLGLVMRKVLKLG